MTPAETPASLRGLALGAQQAVGKRVEHAAARRRHALRRRACEPHADALALGAEKLAHAQGHAQHHAARAPACSSRPSRRTCAALRAAAGNRASPRRLSAGCAGRAGPGRCRPTPRRALRGGPAAPPQDRRRRGPAPAAPDTNRRGRARPAPERRRCAVPCRGDSDRAFFKDRVTASAGRDTGHSRGLTEASKDDCQCRQ